MERAGRIVVNAITVLTVSLSVVTLGLWIRGYQKHDVIAWETMSFAPMDRLPPNQYTRTDTFGVGNLYGDLYFCQVVSNSFSVTKPAVWHFNSLPNPAPASFEISQECQGADGGSRYGIKWLWESHDRIGTRFCGFAGIGTATHFIVVPNAYLILLFSSLPSIRLYGHLRRRYQYRPGHCMKCGYDLRATPDRCPECGFEPATITG